MIRNADGTYNRKDLSNGPQNQLMSENAMLRQLIRDIKATKPNKKVTALIDNARKFYQ